MKKILTVIITLIVLASAAYSQATGSATITATVVEPISISKSVESDFGNVAVIFSGSVKVTPVEVRSKAGSVVIPATSGTFTAATFYTSGLAGYSYTITIPSEPLTIKNGSKRIKVNIQSEDSSLNTDSELVAGVYVSVTPFNMTVNYN